MSTHWGRVTYFCVGKLSSIGSDNDLAPGRRQAIIWINAEILLIWPVGTNFNEILIEIQTLKKIRWKIWSPKCRPFTLGLMLRIRRFVKTPTGFRSLHLWLKRHNTCLSLEILAPTKSRRISSVIFMISENVQAIIDSQTIGKTNRFWLCKSVTCQLMDLYHWVGGHLPAQWWPGTDHHVFWFKFQWNMFSIVHLTKHKHCFTYWLGVDKTKNSYLYHDIIQWWYNANYVCFMCRATSVKI